MRNGFDMLRYIFLVFFVVSMPLFAAGASHPSPPPRQVVVSVPEPEPAGESLTVILNDLDKALTVVQDGLKQQALTDKDLVGLNNQLTRLPNQLSEVISKATSYASNVKMRLDQVGENTTNLPEDPTVTSERNDLQKRSAKLDGVLKRANLFAVEVTQAQARIDDRRKELFTKSSWWRGFVWDVPDNLYAAFFGFKVGDLVISPFRISIAVLLFVLIYAGSRLFLRWANKRIFNRFDYGTRDSIHTTIGWFGFIVAFCVAINYLGVDFEKLTIIVGALSVGIGFGLQGIVSNFISGLIILWERTIRIGDLILVGTDRGTVSKISIRATTIDTPDCSQVIVPNSMLISGVVTNFVRNDRVGRVHMTLTVSRSCWGGNHQIEKQVREHPLVLKNPPPTVEVAAVSHTLEFEVEISAYVADIGTVPQVKSDLYYLIVKTLYPERASEVPTKPSKKKLFRGVDLED